MRRALLSLEACRVQMYPFKADQPVAGADWEAYVTQIANEALGSIGQATAADPRAFIRAARERRAPAR